MFNNKQGSSRSRRSGGLCRPSSLPCCYCQHSNCSQSDAKSSLCSYFSQPTCDKYYSAHSVDTSHRHDFSWRSCQETKKQHKLRIPNRSRVEADSVGSTVGLVCSNVTIQNTPRVGDQKKDEAADALNFATYLKAFALIYVLPEGEWTAERIDMLLREGADLFNQTSEEHIKEDDQKLLNQPTIYSNAELTVKRNFTLEGHMFTLALEPRFCGDTRTPAEFQPQHIIKNLRPVLLSFFRTGSYCLLLTKVGYLLIWKRRQHAYFVLDMKGRRKDDLTSDSELGVAMLVCLQSIDNVVHLASNLSGISSNDAFTIRELVVMRLVTPDGRIFLRDSVQRSIEFRLIDKNYAYLKSNLHLSINRNEPFKNRSALMVGVAAILASKIDHPATWNTNMLDRLICYGVELCRSLWAETWVKSHPIDLDAFPTQLRLGQFVVELKLIPNIRLSDWRCGIRVQGTNFEHHIRVSLEEFSNCLFQINDQMYAIWSKDSFYYFFDPYRHTITGTQVEEDKAFGAKWATVRMFRDLNTMLSVFQQLLKESNRQSQFYLHVVKIRNLAECPKGYALQPISKEEECDVLSLNERILFQQQEATNCAKSLMDNSDTESELLDKLESNSVENLLLDTSDDGEMNEMESDCAEEEKQPKSIPRSPSKQKKGSKSKAKTRALSIGKSPKTGLKRGCNCLPGNSPLTNDPRKDNKNERQRNGKHKNEKEKKQNESKDKQKHGTKFNEAEAPHEPLKDVNNKCQVKNPSTMCPTDCPNVCPIAVVGKFTLKSSPRSKNIPMAENKTNKQCCCTGSAEKPITRNCSPQPRYHNHRDNTMGISTNYPGFTRHPHVLAVVGSESGTVESLNRLLKSAFKVSNRVLSMTPWGNYVVFKRRQNDQINSFIYYIFDGCTCNIDRFRHLDLNCGQAGLLSFPSQSKVVCYMIDSRETKALHMLRTRLDESCHRCESFLTSNQRHQQSGNEGN